MLDLEQRHLATVQDILARHVPHARVWAFGSRVTGHAKPFSDLDLAVEAAGELGLGVLGALREDFSESYLPMMVDVLDLNGISAEFRQVVERDRVAII